MRLTLDPAKCQGHGRCYSLAPAVFDADDVGHCVLLVDTVPAEHQAAARDGVDNCPEMALTIEG